LDTANFVKEGGQDTCVWVANTGEGIRSMALHVLRNWCLTVFKRPFMHAAFGVMDVTVKEFALIRIIHDLTNRRTGALGNDPVH
jgi:hypothetical protein